ncbi:MAG: thioesterase family protein [Planctomycetota bacterium]
MDGPFRWQRPLAFGDVDWAGILYYPRFLHYCHLAFEDFMGEVAGLSYARFLGELRRGFPAVRVEVDYRRPFRYGDVMTMEIGVLAIGDRSLRLRYRAGVGDGEIHAEAVITTALVDMDRFRSTPVTPELRAALERHRVPDEGTPDGVPPSDAAP